MHSINVFLLKKEELRNEKIDSLIESDELSKIKFTQLNEGILATTFIPNLEEFKKNKTIAKIITDYFGGYGYQKATLFVNGKSVYSKSNEYDFGSSPINDVLKKIGVICKNGMDEFDTIELGSFRKNEDFE